MLTKSKFLWNSKRLPNLSSIHYHSLITFDPSCRSFGGSLIRLLLSGACPKQGCDQDHTAP
ncbi:hypothetical protein SynA1560_01959 [Synechococcus sp. A15-60]|nr:hypothetical protein SynA1560_01959 [Synechococcus sp. A15-60]